MNISNSQNNTLPYYEIPDYPSEYNEGTVVARLIDGLGFRYYWATEGLRAEDLAFKPSDDARTTGDTVDHILGLTNVVLHSAIKKVNKPNKKIIWLFKPLPRSISPSVNRSIAPMKTNLIFCFFSALDKTSLTKPSSKLYSLTSSFIKASDSS